MKKFLGIDFSKLRFLSVVLTGVLGACASVQVDRPDFLVRGYSPESKKCLAERNFQRFHSSDSKNRPLDTVRPQVEGCNQQEVTSFANRDETTAFGRKNDEDDNNSRTTLKPDNLSFDKEWEFNRGDKKAPPQMCLALSGGGVRSAAFSIGILKALSNSNEKISLNNIDIISSASGGAYAMSWLIMQYFHQKDRVPEFTHSELFARDHNNQNPYVDYLLDNPSVMSMSEYISGLTASVATTPYNFALNAVFGWHKNTTPARKYYEGKLTKIFATNPLNVGEPKNDIPFSDLLEYYVKKVESGSPNRPPFFIVNTTAFIEEDIRHHAGRLSNSIYDFNILQFGSDALGRYVHPTETKKGPPTGEFSRISKKYLEGKAYPEMARGEPIGFMRSISVSGAALDTSALVAGPSQRTFTSLANIDLGLYIDNPGLSDWTRRKHRMLPFPLYYFKNYIRDTQGTDIYLSDGGHSENLGAFSLIRRLCNEIIIVDAEHDPAYEFQAYALLKHSIRNEMGVDFEISDIDKLLASHDESSMEAINALRTDRESVLPGTGPHIDYSAGSRWLSVAKKPVMDGKICCFPYPGRENVNDKDNNPAPIKVKYIKLGYWANCEDHSTGDFVKDYFCERKGDNGKYPFPQDETANQNFNSRQFEAYMTLGDCIAKERLLDHKYDDESVIGVPKCSAGERTTTIKLEPVLKDSNGIFTKQ